MSVSVENAFSAATCPPPSPRVRKKKPAPFSLRLSPEERERLIVEAAGAPLGTYIRAKLFSGGVPIRVRRSGLAVEDRMALAQALALLGASRLSSNLNQLARLANTGSLPVTPETDAALQAACAEIQAIRALLVRALGLKPEDRP